MSQTRAGTINYYLYAKELKGCFVCVNGPTLGYTEEGLAGVLPYCIVDNVLQLALHADQDNSVTARTEHMS